MIFPQISNVCFTRYICNTIKQREFGLIKGECSVFKNIYIMDENDSLSEYNPSEH